MSPRIKKFFSYYKPYSGLLTADLVCATVVAGITLVLPLCIRYVTNSVLENGVADALSQLYRMGGLMLGLVIIHTACNTFVDYSGHMMGTFMEHDMRNELFAHYQTLSFSFYDDHRVGQLMTRLSNDLEMLSELYHHGPEDILIASLKFFGTFIILMTLNIQLTLILFALLPLMLAYSLYTNKQLNQTMRSSKDRMGDINAQIEDSLAGIRVVQSFNNESVEQQKFAQANHRFVNSRRDVYKSEAYFYEPLAALTQLLIVVVVFFGGFRILNGSFNLADLLTYILYVGILIEPIQRYINFARLFQEGVTGFERFMEMLEVQAEIKDAPNALELKTVRGNIEFKNVGFKYQGGQEVLQNLSLKINAGEFIALVGASGVGKTTLCSLIPRFYELDAGNILLDNQNIKDIQLASLRQNIGVVQQDVYLFAGSIAENIAYGRPNANQEDIIEAAKHANAHEYIMSLPSGYATDVGQRGVKLSGGQKQRLSIARVFLKNPPILIFDEATSSLDNESEKAVQTSLERLSNNRTTIVIAHRLSTIRNAQRIVVLNQSGIAEEGTHDELIALNGSYANLHQMQLRL